MRNVTAEQTGKTLTITIDLDAPTVPSRSGKTAVIASTEGNVKIAKLDDGRPVVLGLNLYVSR